MKTDITKAAAEAAEGTLFLGDDWFDPLETGVRTRIRGFIDELLEAELDTALGRDQYERPRLAEKDTAERRVAVAGHWHGHRERQLMGTFGPAMCMSREPVWKHRMARRPSGRSVRGV